MGIVCVVGGNVRGVWERVCVQGNKHKATCRAHNELL